MADSPILPGVQGWRDGSGKPMPAEFYRFLRDLVRYIGLIDGNTAELAAIEARLAALESQTTPIIGSPGSVQVLGTWPSIALQFFNDVVSPGDKYFYGTDGGAKGWYERLLSTLADVDLTGLADGDAIVWDAGAMKFVPGSAGSSLFNYITTDGEPYATEDYADLYAGE